MLNIERYRTILENYDDSALDCDLDCNIYEIRKKCEDIKNCLCISKSCSECRKENIEWLLSEYKEPVLTEEEKEYLSSVIKPFRKFVVYIEKIKYIDGWERITFYSLNLKSWECVTILPPFQSGTRFKGMELNKQYKLEKLEL